MKKVSVIVPVYNTSKYLDECINSIIKQTYKNLEIIFINDSSNDDSLEVISKYKDKRIKIIDLKENKGVAVARNKGIEISTGDYICFLDSDDYWNLKKIEKQVKFMEKHNYTFIYSDYAFLKNGVKKLVRVPSKIIYKEALKNTTIFTSTVMFNMKYLTKEDIYMPNLRRGQDTATWWNVLRKGITAYAINEVLAIYRIDNKNSLSSNKFSALKRTWNIYKLQDLNIFQRLYYFMFYVLNAIKRRL